MSKYFDLSKFWLKYTKHIILWEKKQPLCISPRDIKIVWEVVDILTLSNHNSNQNLLKLSKYNHQTTEFPLIKVTFKIQPHLIEIKINQWVLTWLEVITFTVFFRNKSYWRSRGSWRKTTGNLTFPSCGSHSPTA